MSVALQERPRILVVEDEHIVAMDLERSLVQLGYDVAGIADDAAEALRLVATTVPHLVLMDIQLAGGDDGIEVAEQIRIRWQIPVVFVTAHTNSETLRRAKTAAPLGYLSKPFRPQELNATVVVALHQHRLAREWFAEHAWLTTLLGSLGEGVIATDEIGRVRYLNAAAEALIEWTQAEAAGKPIEEIYSLLTPAGEPVEMCQLRRALTFHRPLQRQVFCLLTRSGRKIAIEDVAAPIDDAHGQLTGAAAVFVDISERQHAEKERDRLMRELERSNQDLSRFSYAVSHDLQAPVRTVRSFAELLVKRTQGNLGLEETELLMRIAHATEGMQRLIQSLLRYAQAGHGVLRRESVSGEAAVEAVRITLAPLLNETSGNLRCCPLPTFQADRVQMEQLFQNLIGNALQYRRPGVPPEIRVWGETTEEGWHFSVTDNSEGIPPDQAEAIFCPLKRLHGEDVPGTGLGLALCRTIVERHGGGIWVESSEVGEGTTIRFFLRRPEWKEEAS